MWAALAIHDTSSIVGAAKAFGAEALMVGTTVKLVRALWLAHTGLSVALFAIGSGISKTSLRGVGARAMLQAVVLWYLVAMGTLGAVRANLVTL